MRSYPDAQEGFPEETGNPVNSPLTIKLYHSVGPWHQLPLGASLPSPGLHCRPCLQMPRNAPNRRHPPSRKAGCPKGTLRFPERYSSSIRKASSPPSLPVFPRPYNCPERYRLYFPDFPCPPTRFIQVSLIQLKPRRSPERSVQQRFPPHYFPMRMSRKTAPVQQRHDQVDRIICFSRL